LKGIKDGIIKNEKNNEKNGSGKVGGRSSVESSGGRGVHEYICIKCI
jgi:hypothetical protein